jgi:hypothetical protein
MQRCIMCRKTIPDNRELCDEHRNILRSIVDVNNNDPEMQHRWNSLLDLFKNKIYATTAGEDVDIEVFQFIDEINSEFDSK